MKKITLTIGCYLYLLAAHAQIAKTDSAFADSSQYKSRKLTTEEVNFVSSYYVQDGNNSAVTGGIGTEELRDIANTINIRMTRKDHHNRTRILTAELGIDAYSSASSDKIDPSTISSASYSDMRYYPSVSYTVKDDSMRYSAGGILSFSKEYDYTSVGTGVHLSHTSKDKSRELSLKLLAFFDTWRIILPIELRDVPMQLPDNKRNSFSASLLWAQVVNKRLQLAVMADAGYQQGLLGTMYHRVYFSDGSLSTEKLPTTRVKLPVGIRANYFLGDRFVIRSYYRFYTDNWGLNAHTASLEVPVKITPALSIAPYYRYYMQSAVKYFAPYMQHQQPEEFYTSDYDLSEFSSQMPGVNLRFSSAEGILGIKHWNSVELRYGYYIRSTGLTANAITLAAGFK
jgi:hypothetical protein